MVAGELPVEPTEILRRFRDNYTNFYRLWESGKKVPPGTQLYTPEAWPITLDKLSLPLQTAIANYESRHPDQTLTPVKFMRAVNGRPTLVVEDETPLPPEGEMVTLSHTITVTGEDEAQVITELLVART